MTDRRAMIAQLHQMTEEKMQQFQGLIDDLRSSNTETKSSMGDKYETSREMLQQEIMQIQRQLAIFQEHQTQVKKLTDTPSEIVKTGSIAKTTFGNFIITTSMGEFQVDGEKFISISEQSPLAQQLMNKKVGDSFLMQGKSYQVLEVG